MNTPFTPTALKRWAPWTLAALVATALGFWAFTPRPFEVEVTPVRWGRFEQAIDEDGQWRLKNRYVVSAPLAAELIRPTLKVGDRVQAGEVLATLTPLTPGLLDARNHRVLQQRVGRDDAARLAAAAQLKRLQTTLTQAGLDVQRAQRLAEDDFIAPAALDQTVLAYLAAAQAMQAGQAQLRAAEFSLAESQAALTPSPLAPSSHLTANAPKGDAQSAIELKSPVAGRVVKLHPSSGGPVAAGQALMEVGDLSTLEAVIDVLSTDAHRLMPGLAVRLTSGGSAPITGQLSRIEPVAFTKVSALGIEEQRVHVLVDLPPNNFSDGSVSGQATGQAPAPSFSSGLGDGFRVEAHITLFAKDKVLLVPSAALVRVGDSWQVLVWVHGRAQARAVDVQARNADVAWVRDDTPNGVKAGDSVVLYPGTLRDGQRIKVKSP